MNAKDAHIMDLLTAAELAYFAETFADHIDRATDHTKEALDGADCPSWQLAQSEKRP